MSRSVDLRSRAQLAGSGSGKNTSYETSLLEWLKTITKDYDDINLDDGFKSKSFHEGKVCSAPRLSQEYFYLTL
jgi:hypothetical protein